MIGQTGTDGFYNIRQGAASRFPETYVRELRGYYIASGGETSISAGDLIGDSISWNASAYLNIRVLRSNGGEQIPFIPGMGATGWGVNLTSPPTIEFRIALSAGEVVYVLATNMIQSAAKPPEKDFPYHLEVVSAGSSKTEFIAPYPFKTTWKNGQLRGKHYDLYVDGILMTPSQPGTTDSDYVENAVPGADYIGSVSFDVAVGEPGRDINVVWQSRGHYRDDSFNVSQLNTLTSRVNSEFLIQEYFQEALGPTHWTADAQNQIPDDTSLPLITEGRQFDQIDFTPKQLGSVIEVEAVIITGPTTSANSHQVALFKNDTAIRASRHLTGGANYCALNRIMYRENVSALTAIDFELRYGTDGVYQLSLNAAGASYTLGNTIASWWRIREIMRSV